MAPQRPAMTTGRAHRGVRDGGNLSRPGQEQRWNYKQGPLTNQSCLPGLGVSRRGRSDYRSGDFFFHGCGHDGHKKESKNPKEGSELPNYRTQFVKRPPPTLCFSQKAPYGL